MRTGRMEVDCANPISVTFASHDVFLSFHVPDLPGAVVRGCGHDLFSHVKRHSSNGLAVGCYFGARRQSARQSFVTLAEEGIRSRIFREGSILCSTLGERAIHKGRVLERLCVKVLLLFTVGLLYLLLHFVLV